MIESMLYDSIDSAREVFKVGSFGIKWASYISQIVHFTTAFINRSHLQLSMARVGDLSLIHHIVVFSRL